MPASQLLLRSMMAIYRTQGVYTYQLIAMIHDVQGLGSESKWHGSKHPLNPITSYQCIPNLLPVTVGFGSRIRPHGISGDQFYHWCFTDSDKPMYSRSQPLNILIPWFREIKSCWAKYSDQLKQNKYCVYSWWFLDEMLLKIILLDYKSGVILIFHFARLQKWCHFNISNNVSMMGKC